MMLHLPVEMMTKMQMCTIVYDVMCRKSCLCQVTPDLAGSDMLTNFLAQLNFTFMFTLLGWVDDIFAANH